MMEIWCQEIWCHRKSGVRLARLQDQVPAGGFTVKDFSMAIITAIRNVSGKIFIRYKR
jgi:hypothetical protein